MKKSSNIYDVALLAKVSAKTVSRVINNEPHVKAETVNKVKFAISALDYSPNSSARSLRSQRSYNLGLVYSNPSPYYITEIQDGMTTCCKGSSYDVLIHPCDYQSSKIVDEVVSLITDKKVDGLVLTPPLTDLPELIQHLESINATFVCLSSIQPENRASIHCDERQSAKKITQYLISLGHQHIGFIKGHPDHGGSHERFLGFQDGLISRQIKLDEGLIKQGYFSLESGQECTYEMLKSDNIPTAIFASNDDMAVGAIITAQQIGFKVPNDISIAGFDDSPIASHIWPRLTTIRQPISMMAEQATRYLIDSLSNAEPSLTQQFQCELIIRESAQILSS